MKWLAILLLAPLPAYADPISVFVFLADIGINTAAAAWIASNAVTIALTVGSVAVGNYQRRKAQQRARAAYNASLQDRLVMTATVDGARSRIYGEARNVDGVVFKATRGSNSEFYTLLVAVAGHEVDSIGTVYFNDEAVTLDGSGYVQTAPWYQTTAKSATASITLTGGAGSVTLPYTPISGSVSVSMVYSGDGGSDVVSHSLAGTLVSVTGVTGSGSCVVSYQYEEGKSYARVRKYLGDSAQDLSADLVADFPALCTTNDKFKGIALLRVDLEYSQEAFSTGVPSISAVVRGAKCYDPRTATTAWTQNPAVIIRDWVRHPYAGNTTSLSDDDVIAAANVCDADTGFVSPSGTVTMDTYQCGIVCKLDQDPAIALSEMVESMAGRWGWAGGVLRIVAGAYRAPVATITEDWVSDASDIRISPSPPRSELVNSYRPTISNRDNKYQAEPAPPLTVASYVTADGQQLDAEITMGGVTSIQHAQHIAGILLRDARQSLVVQLPCNLRALKLELFDTVNVTLSRFGWTAKLFEAMGWNFTMQGGVVLTLKEANATVYDVDAGFSDLGDDDNSELPLPWDVPTITGLSVTSGTASLTDGSLISRTQVSWSALNDATVTQSGRVEVQYFEVGTSPGDDWPSQVEAGSSSSTTISGLRAGYVYVFRARAVNGVGVRGRWSLQVAHKIAEPPALDWSNVTDRPKLFRAVARGYVDTSSPHLPGFYNGETDALLYGYTRSYMLVRVRRSDGVITHAQTYDVYNNGEVTEGRNHETLATDLNNTGPDHIAVVYTQDEPKTGRLLGGLPAAMYRCGASRAVYSSDQFKIQGSYVLIGIGGCGEGNGFEAYSGDTDSSTNSWCDVSFYLQNGNAVVSGTTASPRAGSIATEILGAGAATHVNTDDYDFAGTSWGTITARSWSVTPTYDCTIEFSAKITATNVPAIDTGSYVSWYAVRSGSADLFLGQNQGNTSAAQECTAVTSFSASAGVPITFEIRTYNAFGANPAIKLYRSYMRATEVRR